MYSGTFTIENTESGDYRTFLIKKVQTNDFMTGNRLVGLLTGPDNYADFKLFGYVDEGLQRISVFKKHQGTEKPSAYEHYARMLNVLVAGETCDDERLKHYSVKESRSCMRCGRQLTTPESIEAGIGPECAKK